MIDQASTPDAAGDETEFRRLSPAAAMALALGVASPLALASPLLVCIPVAAILLALLALAKIGASGGEATGEPLARWALALAAGCLAAAAIRGPVRDAMLRREARAVGRAWLQRLAEGDAAGALPLMTDDARIGLVPEPTPEAPRPSPDVMHSLAIANLGSHATTLRLRALKQPLTFDASPESEEWPIFDRGRTLLLENFTVVGASGSGSCRLQIRLARHRDYEASGSAWRIDQWQLQDDPTSDSDGANSR